MIKTKNNDVKEMNHFVGKGRYAKYATHPAAFLFSHPKMAY